MIVTAKGKIIEIFQVELTAPFDEKGRMPHFHIDWSKGLV